MNSFYVYMYILFVKEAYSWIKHISIIVYTNDRGSWEHVQYGTQVKFLSRQIALPYPYIITDPQNKTQ
jgi:hypothetical protein